MRSCKKGTVETLILLGHRFRRWCRCCGERLWSGRAPKRVPRNLCWKRWRSGLLLHTTNIMGPFLCSTHRNLTQNTKYLDLSNILIDSYVIHKIVSSLPLIVLTRSLVSSH